MVKLEIGFHSTYSRFMLPQRKIERSVLQISPIITKPDRAGDPVSNDHESFLRCGHPAQQHGRRMPLRILSRPTSILRLRVSSCLAEVTQQIHSFLASGVISFQSAKTCFSESSAFFKSAGSLWRSVFVIRIEGHTLFTLLKIISRLMLSRFECLNKAGAESVACEQTFSILF